MTFASFFEIYEADKKQRVKGKHMGIQKPCNPHKDFTVFRESKDSRD